MPTSAPVEGTYLFQTGHEMTEEYATDMYVNLLLKLSQFYTRNVTSLTFHQIIWLGKFCVHKLESFVFI